MLLKLKKIISVPLVCPQKTFFSFFFFCDSYDFSFSSGVGETIHITSKYFGHEANAVSTSSKVDTLEAESVKLRRDLIFAMDEANSTEERAKVLTNELKVEKQLTLEMDERLQAANQKVKTVVAKAIKAFQQTEEYNTMLFNWDYKGFELL